MSHQKNVKILAFVGLAGSGKSSTVDYLRGKGYPEAHSDRNTLNESDNSNSAIIQQVNNLFHAGQHRILIDDIFSLSEYKSLKRAFPGELIVVGLFTHKHLRHRRLSERRENPLTDAEAQQRDWDDVELLEKAAPIALADHYILNDGAIDELNKSINQLLIAIKF